jgi:hypothetical protein
MFLVGLTALDVAFITSIAAAAAAVAAPISAWVVSIANNRHDRWVKTYADLRAAYSALLQDIITARSMIQRMAQAYEHGDESLLAGAAPFVDDATRIQHRASVAVLASPRVGRALEEWDAAWRDSVTPQLSGLSGAQRSNREIAATLRGALDSVEQPWARLCEAIRSDLRDQ